MDDCNIALGFADYDFRTSELFYRTAHEIYLLYRSFGALPLRTATVKPMQLLNPHTASALGKASAESIIMALDQNGLALRYDQTEPTTAYILQNYDKLSFPLRICASGMVFRKEAQDELESRRRQQEFFQTDYDIVDSTEGITIDSDCEAIDVLYQALTMAMRGLEGSVQIRFNNRKLIEGILESLGMEDDEMFEKEFLTLLDQYYKITPEVFEFKLMSLLETYSKKEYVDGIMAILKPNLGVNELERTVESYGFGVSNTIQAAIRDIKVVDGFAQQAKIPCIFNPLTVRGLDIYTGTVFEGYMLGAESYGAIAGGGRYDNLGRDMKKQWELDAIPDLSGVGFSIGLDRIIQYKMDETSTEECLVDLVIGPQCASITNDVGAELWELLVSPLRVQGKRVATITTRSRDFDEKRCLATYRPRVYVNSNKKGLYAQSGSKKTYYDNASQLAQVLLKII